MNPVLRRDPLVLLFILTAGCIPGGKSFMPSIDFERLDVKELTWEDISTDFVFKVNNPAPLEIALATFDYRLTLGGAEWITGNDPNGLTLPSEDASELALPVDLVFQNLFDMVEADRGQDTIPFELSGSFGFDTPLGVIELPYLADGEFPALRAPSFSFKKLVVTEYSLSGLDLDLKFDADNEHESTIDFTNFDYAFGLESTDLASGSVASMGSVEGDSARTLTVPVGITSLSVIKTAYDLLTTNDQIDIHLAGQTDIAIPIWPEPITLTFDETGLADIEL